MISSRTLRMGWSHAVVGLWLIAFQVHAQPASAPSATSAPEAVSPTNPSKTNTSSNTQNTQEEEFQDTDPSALTDFREPLDPYGHWVDDAKYGTVWVPNVEEVGPDFAPYQTAGHWELTRSDDWIWVSDYRWGYIPFHYGRWVWIPGSGWAWVPGRWYAPAWVVWRTSDYGYIGWAPMPPDYYWYGGVAVGVWFGPPAAYVFVPTAYVFHHHVHRYVVHDTVIVERVAAHSRNYVPASAHVSNGHTVNNSATTSTQTGSSESTTKRAHYPAFPSLTEAKIPASAVPSTRAKDDETAIAYSTRSGTEIAKRQPAVRSKPTTTRANKSKSKRGKSSWRGPSVQTRPSSRPSTERPKSSPRTIETERVPNADRIPMVEPKPPRVAPKAPSVPSSSPVSVPTSRKPPPSVKRR